MIEIALSLLGEIGNKKNNKTHKETGKVRHVQ